MRKALRVMVALLIEAPTGADGAPVSKDVNTAHMADLCHELLTEHTQRYAEGSALIDWQFPYYRHSQLGADEVFIDDAEDYEEGAGFDE